ncbi:hypothetical protein DVH24_024766 [Malus domestica]|uniref:Uncharacterized protein n=1 Tax=Malus domestica TaxID=3750 RepID=A0A498JNC4_MALDO|nr:hypothetical protein DVH24_024766 [Malus domestica]
MSDRQSQPLTSQIGEVLTDLTTLISQLQVEESSVSAEPARVDLKQAFIDRFLNLLNTSSLEDLENMKGIGETRAAKIMEVRAEEETPFTSLADLGKIGLSIKQAKGLRGWSTRGRPSEGLRDRTIEGEWQYVGEMVNENLDRIRVRTILYSKKVKFLPMHILPPNPKGKYPILCLHPPWMLSLNLSGLNSLTSSPHRAGSWCMPTMSIHMFVPLGIDRSWLT